jgi:hypothetical protein
MLETIRTWSYGSWENEPTSRLWRIIAQAISQGLNPDEIWDVLNKSSWLDFFFDFTETHEPFTRWTEGEIFKIELDGRNYIIVKKRGNDDGNEFNVHRAAIKSVASIPEENLISLPKLFWSFDRVDKKGINSTYILMEYIPWKTLYHFMVEHFFYEQYKKYKWTEYEQIFNHFLRTAEQSGAIGAPRWFQVLSRLSQNNLFQFSDDTDAEKWLKELFSDLQDAWLIWINNDLEKYFFKFLQEKPIFTQKEFYSISRHLREFITLMNGGGIYHRDLWANPRNLIFSSDGRAYVIDFGKGVISTPDEEAFESHVDNIRYFRDTDVIDFISSFSEHDAKTTETTALKEKVTLIKGSIDIETLKKKANAFHIREEELMRAFNAMNHGSSIAAIMQHFEQGCKKTPPLNMSYMIDFSKAEWKLRIPKWLEETKKYAIRTLLLLALLPKTDWYGLISELDQININKKTEWLKKIFNAYMELLDPYVVSQ